MESARSHKKGNAYASGSPIDASLSSDSLTYPCGTVKKYEQIIVSKSGVSVNAAGGTVILVPMSAMRMVAKLSKHLFRPEVTSKNPKDFPDDLKNFYDEYVEKNGIYQATVLLRCASVSHSMAAVKAASGEYIGWNLHTCPYLDGLGEPEGSISPMVPPSAFIGIREKFRMPYHCPLNKALIAYLQVAESPDSDGYRDARQTLFNAYLAKYSLEISEYIVDRLEKCAHCRSDSWSHVSMSPRTGQ